MNYNVATYPQAPLATPNTQGAFNNAVAKAQASSDQRFNMKQYDRPGVSRSAGTRAMAGIQGANSLAQGLVDAYQIPATDAATNADNDLQYQRAREQYGLGISGIASQNDYANALSALQRQQDLMNYPGTALGGLLNSNLVSYLNS